MGTIRAVNVRHLTITHILVSTCLLIGSVDRHDSFDNEQGESCTCTVNLKEGIINNVGKRQNKSSHIEYEVTALYVTI